MSYVYTKLKRKLELDHLYKAEKNISHTISTIAICILQITAKMRMNMHEKFYEVCCCWSCFNLKEEVSSEGKIAIATIDTVLYLLAQIITVGNITTKWNVTKSNCGIAFAFLKLAENWMNFGKWNQYRIWWM